MPGASPEEFPQRPHPLADLVFTWCSRLNGAPPQKKKRSAHILILGTRECDLIWKNVFVGLIKLGILR